MIVGIGTDLLRIGRLVPFDELQQDPFYLKTFTQKEREMGKQRSNPTLFFTTRFAGKEAVFKCFKIDGNTIRLNDIEILNDETGAVYVTLYGQLKTIAEQKNIHFIELSLSYEEEYALAFAVAHNYE